MFLTCRMSGNYSVRVMPDLWKNLDEGLLGGDVRFQWEGTNWNADPFLSGGFRNAGNAIILAFLEERGRHRSLLFPALYCYRQHIELLLKHITSRLNFHLDGVETEYPIEHRLHVLWNKMENAAKELMGDLLFTNEDERNLFYKVKARVMELNNLDPKGTGFRYPDVVKTMTVDVHHLQKAMTEMSEYLSAFFDYCTAGEN